jgi:ATP-dependent DNA helicase Rep
VLQCRDEPHEAERVVSALLHHKFKHRTAFSDYALLYRGNHQARPFERALREHRIPYVLSGGTGFFERIEVKDLLGYLRLIANPEDDNALLRIINTPRREIGPGTLEKLGSYAGEHGQSLLAACREPGLEGHLAPRAVARLRRFADWLQGYVVASHESDPASLTRGLLGDLGYEQWLRETSPSPKAAQRRIDNLNELVSWISRLAKDDSEPGALPRIVARITLSDILDRGQDEEGGDAVRMMTLHGAKGLEFPHVFIVGMEEELLPHRTSLAEDGIEEERRLAYVGMTRARASLTLSLAQHRRRGGELQPCAPSRFLGELPEEDLCWEGRGARQDPAERRERGQAHLANLRELLQQR